MKRRAFLRGLGAVGAVALAPRIGETAARPLPLLDRLRDAKIEVGARVSLSVTTPSASRDTVDVALGAGRSARRVGRNGTLTLTATVDAVQSDAVDLVSASQARRALVDQHDVALTFGAWSRENYVLLPGACYAGNRFQSRRAAYPPLLTERADIGPHVPPIVPDIPRLSAGTGPSGLKVDASDLATPALGVFLPAARLGVLLLTRPTVAGDGAVALSVTETDDRTRATITVAGTPARQARATEIPVRLFIFDCPDIPSLFAKLHLMRKQLTGPTPLIHDRPFSAAFAVHEQRLNRRFVDKPGYYAVGGRATAYADWQTGWCGGLVTTLPLLAAGSKSSRERALATIAFGLERGQAASGFFHGVSDGNRWYEDGFAAPLSQPPRVVYKHARRWHLVRRSADALTFLVKQLALLDRRPELREGGKIPAAWGEAARRTADALVRLWDRYHQLGQFVDIETGELVVGGSTSAGLAPAGLALAAAQFKEPRYLQAARAIGEHYHERFVRVGLTCGGPGDALQAPDSQSAAALLESFVTLYEATGEAVWIERAHHAAHLLSSWVISYESGHTCGSRTRATGAVLWGAASAIGSPGYVLASGDALLRLHRATGDVTLLDLLRDTAHNLAQYLPNDGDPVRSEGDDRRCARADTGRWLDPAEGVVPVDGVFDSIGLLAYTEVPGIYVRPDTGFKFVFDHVTVKTKERTPGRLVLAIANPTRSEATVRVLAESAADVARPLRPGAVLDAQTAVVPAGATLQVTVPPL